MYGLNLSFSPWATGRILWIKCKPPGSKEGVVFVDLMSDNQNKHKLFRLAESAVLLS